MAKEETKFVDENHVFLAEKNYKTVPYYCIHDGPNVKMGIPLNQYEDPFRIDYFIVKKKFFKGAKLEYLAAKESITKGVLDYLLSHDPDAFYDNYIKAVAAVEANPELYAANASDSGLRKSFLRRLEQLKGGEPEEEETPIPHEGWPKISRFGIDWDDIGLLEDHEVIEWEFRGEELGYLVLGEYKVGGVYYQILRPGEQRQLFPEITEDMPGIVVSVKTNSDGKDIRAYEEDEEIRRAVAWKFNEDLKSQFPSSGLLGD